jgi:RNA polymerase sigma-70 factor (ECF subfamily)
MELTQKKQLFEEEALPHLRNLYYFALKICGNQQEAENLVQETFYKAFRAFNTYSLGTNIKAWLFKILNNTFISMKRKENRTPQPEADDVIERKINSREDHIAYLDTELQLLENVMDENLEHAFNELTEDNRKILFLVDVEEMPYDQVSEVLEIPVGTVKSRVSRARNKLRDLFLLKRKQQERSMAL